MLIIFSININANNVPKYIKNKGVRQIEVFEPCALVEYQP
jgi:hypothetical protein